MFQRFLIALGTLVLATAALGQDTSDIEKRLKALEEKVAAMAPSPDVAEIRREIDVLTQEIESLKLGQKKSVAVADTQSFGFGRAASKVYRAEPGVSFGGYGEMLYQRAGANDATANVERAVLYTGYKFNPNVLFNSELEVEDASTEKGGQVSVEFAYLDYLVRPELNYRAGLLLLPMGLINEQHEPTAYLGSSRPLVEQRIIPATWAELGAGVFGDVGRVSYRSYLVTGLDANEFDAAEGLRNGRQAGGHAKANDWALTARADWHPFEGTMFGGSLYSGNSGQGLTASGRRIAGHVTLGEVHADAKFRGVSLRALVARGRIGDTARINEARGLTGNESVASALGGWYVEGGYDLATIFPRGEMSMTPYARYERLDTQRRVPSGFTRNPENELKVFTLGFAFKPIQQTVIKIDWQNVKHGDRWNVALGYIF